MRRALDGLYKAALIASALSMLAIALLVLLQVTGRIVDRVLSATGGQPLGLAVPSLAEIGGFLFVAAAFLALPSTLRAGVHVRVTMLTQALPRGLARVLMAATLLAATALALFAAWHSGVQALDSWTFSSVSYGMVRIPLWLPQGAMTLGLAIFALALIDETLAALRGATPAFAAAETARTADSMEGH